MSDVFDTAKTELGQWLPHLVGALAILVLGLAVAWILGALTTRLLAALGADRLAQRLGVHESLGRPGTTPAVSSIAGRVVRVALALVVVVAAISALGIGGIQPALNALLLYVPRVIAALVLLAAGVVVGKTVGRWIDGLGTQLDVGVPLGRIASAIVIGIFALTALDQLGVPTDVTIVLGAIVLGVAGLTAALAFGLGGRDLARELSAGRYVASSYALGDTIEVDSVQGEIVAFEPVVVVVRRDDGRTARIPNHVLLHSVVLRDGLDESAGTAG